MAKIYHGGNQYEMDMKEFFIFKKASNMIEELLGNPELLQEFNKQMRSYKLNKLKNRTNGD